MTATVPLGAGAGVVPTTTRALVWRGADSLDVERLAVAPLRPGEVLAEILLSTVCGSDRHTVSGRRAAPSPSVLGHESVGRVVAIGAGGARTVLGVPVTVRQRIVWGVTVPCGSCDRCRAGLSAKCLRLRKIGHEALGAAWSLSGGYAEHIVLPVGALIDHVPDVLADAVAAPAGCATATVMAVVEKAGELSDRRVAVVGAGMLGIAAAAAAADAGAAHIVSIDPDPGRRELALRFGADRSVGDASEVEQVDVILEFSGSTAALAVVLERLDVGGTAVLAGAVGPVAALRVDPEAVVRRLLTVTGVHNYEPRHLADALSFLVRTSPTRPWAELVAPPVGLDGTSRLLIAAASDSPRTSVAPALRQSLTTSGQRVVSR